MFSIYSKLSFKTKIMFFICTITISVVTITLQIRAKQVDIILKERMSFRTGVIADIISFSISSSEISDKPFLGKYSKFILNEPEIEYVSFYDKNNKLVYAAGNYGKKNIGFATENIFNVDDNFYDVYREIKGENNEKIGSIIVGFPTQSMKEALRNHLFTGIIIWLFAILLIVIVTYIGLTCFLKPLRYLHEAVINMGKRNFDCRAPISSNDNDEIGQIAKQFNVMTEELQSFYKELENKIEKAVDGLRMANQKLEKRTEELSKLNLQLKEMDKRKTEFISIVSHDLKTPLTSSIGFADTLLNKRLNLTEDTKEDFINVIATESRRLSRLISDFLDLTKIEEGIFEPKIEKANIKEIVNRVVEFINTKSKGISIVVESENHFPLMNLDEDRITQVLQNLLSNALKYSPINSIIKIVIKQFAEEIRISVIDQGIGIPDSEKEKVFQKFYRINSDISIKERGTGLGLTIVKFIIELHGGRIWVEDNKPAGSCFIFALPI